MKVVFGVLALIAGAVLGVYVGVWVFLIGGIVDVVEGANADPVNAHGVAWGLAQIFVLASLVGTLIFYFFGFIAYLCFNSGKPVKRY